MTPQELIARVGGPSRISQALGLRAHTTPMRWKTIPDHYVVAIEAATGIPREELRPDLFRGVTVVRPEGEGAR
ncbi:hypothetical protein LV478_11645 [Komagataeibacter oboediens]|uniref:YdaS family helix-turn-helix protein n=1 Tax=Komagataeibacter oboediens TaxID=65958 RepID=UPI0023DA6078|nr:YdaS family helix-turn-helix protein [Komagataeibacter oboediens]WEQ51183.1 hypothetical protein LV478_11645 [Komagataeibacter oboediens]